MITYEELDNLEEAINAAIKQSSFILMAYLVVPEAQSVFNAKDILRNNMVYANALETIENLRKHLDN